MRLSIPYSEIQRNIPPTGRNKMSLNRKKTSSDADALRAKIRSIKRTQRRLLQQLDESIRSTEICLKHANSREP